MRQDCGRQWHPTPVFWPGKFHGLHSPWDQKESHMTEQHSFSLSKTTLKNNKMLITGISLFSSGQLLSHSASLQPYGLQHARSPCPSPTPGVYSNSCPLSPWCHPTTSSPVVPFSSCPQSFPASGSFPMSQLFTSGGQSIGVSASVSVPPMNMQSWFPLGLTGLISLLSKGLSRVFSSTTIQKHQFFNNQPSLWPNSHIHTWLLEKP